MHFIKQLVNLFFGLLILLAIGVVLHQKNIVDFSRWLPILAKKQPVKTYYQWYDNSGQLQITLQPPNDGRNFTLLKTDAVITEGPLHSPSTEIVQPLPEIKVVNTHRDSLREELVHNEMTTQCRWMLERLFDIEKSVENKKSGLAPELCAEYQELLSNLSLRHCKSRSEDIQPRVCR